METYTITPKVDEIQEFIEIATNFSDPLDLVREAISNAYDARASEMQISFEVIKEYGESILKIVLKDNGHGMTQKQLQNFFDLGNSTRRDDESTIGEKGHGTKVYLNSKKIEVKTSSGENGLHATIVEPFKKLHNRKIPIADVVPKNEIDKGTEITIYGYNNNRRDRFTHPILKDHIIWFTKHGSIESRFSELSEVKLLLKGIGENKFEEIEQGHYFPEESKDINKLFDEHETKAPDYYSKQIIKKGELKKYPEVKYQAIFSIEGKGVRYEYNPMLRRQGYNAPEGAYTIRERYGLWICKDYIPIQRKNEWITVRGAEYTKFHAFINCQGLRLTANRGSVDNTPLDMLRDLKDEVEKIYDNIIKSDDWGHMEWLKVEAPTHQTIEKEQKNFERRLKKINRANIVVHKGVTLVEPERESGVFSIFLILSQIEENLFPFHIIDYDTHEGIDVIAKGDNKTPISSAKLYYVEFKRTLSKDFNHSFENLHSVVCWDTDIKHDDVLKDISGQERKMQIISPDKKPDKKDDYTHYFLDYPQKAHKIEVFCLKTYLKEKLGIEFVPRTSDATI